MRQFFFLKDIHKLISKTIPVIEEHPYPINTNPNVELEKEPVKKANTTDNANRNNLPKREPIKTERDFRNKSVEGQRKNSSRNTEKSRSVSSTRGIYASDPRDNSSKDVNESRNSNSYRNTNVSESRKKADSFASSEKPKRKWFSRPR